MNLKKQGAKFIIKLTEMIILISPEKNIPNEIESLHQFFDAGLTHFHLRKPELNEKDLLAYLSKIDKKYYKNIVLHQYHHLTKQLKMRGIHLKEPFRQELGKNLENYISSFSVAGYSVSSSFHKIENIKNCKVRFDYHLLSPVFDSISKKGYKGKNFSVHNIDKKIIGMGGVTADNLAEIKNKGFQGAAVLGAVWFAEKPIEVFKQIKNF